MPEDVLFEVPTPIGIRVRTTREYWRFIVTVKHPVMRSRLHAVKRALTHPDVIRRSRSDPAAFLYYRRDDLYHDCVVVKTLGNDGFIVTAYRTDRVKEGDHVWPR